MVIFRRCKQGPDDQPWKQRGELKWGSLEPEYEPVDSDIGEGSGVLKLSDRDPTDLPCRPGGRSVLRIVLVLQGVDHVLNTLVVANVVCITIVDGSADPSVDDLFQVRPASPHPVSYRHETHQCVGRGALRDHTNRC